MDTQVAHLLGGERVLGGKERSFSSSPIHPRARAR